MHRSESSVKFPVRFSAPALVEVLGYELVLAAEYYPNLTPARALSSPPLRGFPPHSVPKYCNLVKGYTTTAHAGGISVQFQSTSCQRRNWGKHRFSEVASPVKNSTSFPTLRPGSARSRLALNRGLMQRRCAGS
jgi:hypothetical protein